MIDIKKITSTPRSTHFEALDSLIAAQQHLLSALHILESILINNEPEYKESHEKIIRKFLSQFES